MQLVKTVALNVVYITAGMAGVTAALTAVCVGGIFTFMFVAKLFA